jgi:hypothetical protein
LPIVPEQRVVARRAEDAVRVVGGRVGRRLGRDAHDRLAAREVVAVRRVLLDVDRVASRAAVDDVAVAVGDADDVGAEPAVDLVSPGPAVISSLPAPPLT